MCEKITSFEAYPRIIPLEQSEVIGMLCIRGSLGQILREELMPLCFVIPGSHSGGSCGGLNGATGSVSFWILVSELAVKTSAAAGCVSAFLWVWLDNLA